MLRFGGHFTRQTGNPMRPIAISLLAVLLAMPGLSQEKLVESIEVRVVNVDVVVTDRAGNPVTGLTKDDFELFENKKPQKITNLYEVRPGAEQETLNVAGALEPSAAPAVALPPAEMRVRRVVMFIDNSSLPMFQKSKILNSLDKFVENELRPGDEATLVAWSPGLKIVTPFTSDRKLLRAGIATLSARANGGAPDMASSQEQVKRQCNELIDIAKEKRSLTFPQAWDMCKGDVDAYSEEAAHNAKNTLEAMRLTSTTLAGLDGKKVMVIAGAHLPERPGLDLQMWAFQAFSEFLKGLNPTRAMAETSHNLQTFSIEKFARQANSDGVTVYIIDTADTRDFTSAENATATDNSEQFASFTNTAMAYQTIARITGGLMVNSNNFDSAFQTIAKDLGSYYSLGYKPSEETKNAKDRTIVVKAKNPAYRVRSRQSYSPKSSEDQINDRVVANIYSGVKSEWPIVVNTGAPEREGDRFRVPVTIMIPPTVTLLPQENQMVGGFDVFVAVGTDGGAMSKVSKSAQPIKIPTTAEKDLRSKPMTYDMSIVVRPGESTLSVGVVDQISNTSGFARTKIVAR
jgi:VWFA-related protein